MGELHPAMIAKVACLLLLAHAALCTEGQEPVLKALSDPGPFTVFAPNNAAFEKLKTLKNDAGTTLYDFVLKPANSAILTKILQHHVHSGTVKAATATTEAKAGKSVKTLNEDIKLSWKDDKIMLDGNAKVTATTDVMAKNGVVHVIDAVLVPPNVDITTFKATPATKKTSH